MFCKECGKEVNDKAVICINCGCSIVDKKTEEEDIVNVGLCILAVFIPIFGIIYWALKYKETPKAAKAIGLTAIITIAVQMVISIIICVTVLSQIAIFFENFNQIAGIF